MGQHAILSPPQGAATFSPLLPLRDWISSVSNIGLQNNKLAYSCSSLMRLPSDETHSGLGAEPMDSGSRDPLPTTTEGLVILTAHVTQQ